MTKNSIIYLRSIFVGKYRLYRVKPVHKQLDSRLKEWRESAVTLEHFFNSDGDI